MIIFHTSIICFPQSTIVTPLVLTLEMCCMWNIIPLNHIIVEHCAGYLWDWVNHSENYRKPEDHTVHTNRIEGK